MGPNKMSIACSHCAHAIDAGAASTVMPCCAATYHTVCAVPLIVARNYMSEAMYCPACSTELVAAPPLHTESDDGEWTNGAERVRQRVQANPAFATALAAYKTKTRGLTKPMTAASKALQAVRREFQEMIAPHLAAIREARQTVLNSFKMSEVYREGKAAERRAASARTALDNKFPDLTWRERHHIFRANRRFRFVWATRGFRIAV